MMSASDLLRQGVTALFRRRQIAAVLFLGILGGSVVLLLLTPEEYRSEMKFLVRNERADLLISPDRSASAPVTGVTEAQINSEIELLTSADVLRRVVRESGLDRWEASWDPDPQRRAVIVTEKAVERLKRALDVTPVRKANVIAVEYTSRDARSAAAVLGKLSEVYLQAHLRLHRSPGTYGFFRAQKAAYEQELSEQEQVLADLRRQKDAPMLAQQKEALLQTWSHLMSQLYETEASISQNERRAADLRGRLGSVSPRIVTQERSAQNQQAVQSLGALLADLRNRRTQLLTKFLPDDRLVVEVETQIADTKGALDEAARLIQTERATDVNPLRQRLEEELARAEMDLAGLYARRHTLAGQAQQSKDRLSALAEATLKHDTLSRKIREAEENYLLYAKKEEEARIGDALDRQKIANVTVSESPSEPAAPVKPNRRAYLAVGFLLATFGAAAGAFAVEHLSDTVHTPADLEAVTGLRVLATVPVERS